MIREKAILRRKRKETDPRKIYTTAQQIINYSAAQRETHTTTREKQPAGTES